MAGRSLTVEGQGQAERSGGGAGQKRRCPEVWHTVGVTGSGAERSRAEPERRGAESMWGGAGGRERAAGGGAGRGRSGPGRGLLALSGTCECGARQPSGRKPAPTRYRRPSRLRRPRRHGQVGPRGPALDRGGAGRRDQREQLALVRRAGGRAAGPRARAGSGEDRAALQHACPWRETVRNCPGFPASGSS